ncbi:MAG TPA: 1-acyl-sn-glycerol-3-phosphate acyltransferase [Polyangiaceae bacterium]|nr:1-acyl-sn-glycerol-3-phosphate acyltransferase [Polyangiaceae bacterium]
MSTRALAQTYEPNPLLAYVYRRFFEHIHVDETWVATVREAAARGSVVYILRNLSFLDFLALDHLTKRHGLPRIRFANDLGLWVLEPMGKGWFSAFRPQIRGHAAEELTQVIQQGGSAALFLKRPSAGLDVTGRKVGTRRSLSEGDDLIRALFALQRGRSTPILLVPQVFVWTKSPDRREGGVVDALLGSREWPGKIRTTMQFLRNYKNVIFRAGEPVDLAEFLDAAGGSSNGSTAEDDGARVRRLTYALLRRLERERRAIVGPVRKANDRMRSEIIKSPRLQGIIRDLAGEGEKERLVLGDRAYGMLRELESQPEPGVISMLDVALDTIVNRIYDGVEVDQAGLERVRAAAKRGTLVLLPSHKSHLDYLMLSFVFYHANLQLPLIAAGDNLSFFPLGIILRRGGAFFIRRSFSGDRLYGAVVDAYVRRLIREGYSIEFFLEGGRSRTGKLLPPKLGLLNMVVEAAMAVPHKELFFVPVSIGYDRLVEGSSYVHELTGGEKQEEDARGLLKTTGLLRGRYGRLNIQFGEILSLWDIRANGDAAAASPEERSATMHPAKRRSLVTRLAHRVMAEINRATAVTPGAVVATALLNHAQRGISHGELISMCDRLTKVLKGLGARISHALLDARGELREEAIREAAQLFIEAETVVATVPGEGASQARSKRAKIYTGPDVIYVVPDDKRLSLDLSKNIIVHFFVPRALVSTALSSSARHRPRVIRLRQTLRPPSASEPPPAETPGSRISPLARATLEERVRSLSRLFKFEFMFRADATFEQNFAETLGEMAASGELALAPNGDVGPGAGHDGWSGEAWIDFYASVARTFLESYRIAARGLAALQKGPANQKDLVKRALAAGERMFLAGEIERPEAVTRPTIANAYLAFADQGYVSASQGKIALAESFATAAALAAIESKIAGYSAAEDAS